MPFDYILANLLAENESSAGVLFLDDSGEPVDLACVELDPSELRLLGAYVGIYLRRLQTFLEPAAFGEVKSFCIEKRGLHVFARALPEGYCLVLAQRGSCLTGRVAGSLERAAEQLSRELFPKRQPDPEELSEQR